MFQNSKFIQKLLQVPNLCFQRNFANRITRGMNCCDHKQKIKPYCLILMRTGKSEFNQQNLFCGWYNSKLSERGRYEAVTAARSLKTNSIKIESAFTSVLTRANETLSIMLGEIGQINIPVSRSWRLNERHCGGLTGMSEREAIAFFGAEKVQACRHNCGALPPPINDSNRYFQTIMSDKCFHDGPCKKEFPLHESLKQTFDRTVPYFKSHIIPEMQKNKVVLLIAHENSLRGIVKHLNQLSDEMTMKYALPNGVPIMYELNKMTMRPTKRMRYLTMEL